MRNSSVAELNALNEYFDEQREELKKMLQAQQEALASRPNENEVLIKELRLLTEKQESAFGQLQDTLKGLGDKITLSIQNSLKVLSSPSLISNDKVEQQHTDVVENSEQQEIQKKSFANIPNITIYLLAAITFLLLVNMAINIFR